MPQTKSEKPPNRGERARRIVYVAAKRNPVGAAIALAQPFVPSSYLGLAEAFIDRMLRRRS